MVVGDEDKGVHSYRPSLKSLASFNNYPKWKHKLRENCFKRVRQDRTRLLWKLRLSEAQNQSANHEDFIKSTLQDIVSDELKKIKGTSLDESSSPVLGTSTDDMIWEYDGLHTAYQGDCEEMLLEMQRLFYEDLRTEKTRKEPECFMKTWEDEEDEYLARVLYEHMQLNSDQVAMEVWCPICKQGELQENGHHIYCTQCELKLKRGHEVDLNFLRLRLGEAHTEHLDRGCRLRPEFCIETKFGLTALYIKCQGCNTFEVVL
ncbi:RPA-interacting protein B [Sesamum indicum]|uniref:RPA-interacting protein B n=1 Tax=Sesamum indicum TaxID=4182 RepID=A0A6I9TAM5_SESIN|nr:RPA-interacting protein B [Sesamum indicum]